MAILSILGKGVKAQPVINEFLAYNASQGYDSTNHSYSDWIEIHNPGSSSINIGGYYLTDNLSDTTKWQVPLNTVVSPNGFLLIWADGLGTGLHTNFKLSSDGEEIGLFNPFKILVDSLVYNPQQTDISFGRKPDGSDQWVYFDEPTPGEANTTTGYSGFSKAEIPQFSIAGGFYTESQQLVLSALSPSASIRYTLNGNEPTPTSALYTGPIPVDSITVVRAKVYDQGMISSPTATNTYFIGIDKDLPVFSLVCDSAYLWDSVAGIYINSAIDQERLANIEYYENHQPVLNQSVGIQIHGFVARYLPQKIFGIYAGSKYGKPTLDHKFFYEKEIYSFPSIFLRNGGFPENSSTLFRDGLMQNLVSGKVDLDYQAYRPAVLYLNGQYWGIYNIRERQNDEYLVANRNIDPANIDYLENYWYEELNGDKLHFLYFMEFITNNDINDPGNWSHIKDLVDVDNLIDYMITEIYFANTDWPGANQKFWRSRDENGKWRWFLTDVEFGFGMVSDYDHNTLEFALATDGDSWANPPEATFLFRKMLENTEFRNEFIQRFTAHLNISYNPQRVVARIDSFRNNIAEEMPYEIERWKDEAWYPEWGGSYQVIGSMELWEAEVEKMRQFAINRASHAQQHLIDRFGIDGVLNLTTYSVGGSIEINGVKQMQGQHSGLYFKNIPLRLEAIPSPGMKFAYWVMNSTIVHDQYLEFTQGADLNASAVFSPDDVSFVPEVIDYDLTLAQSGSPYVATGDIVIYPGNTLTLEQGVEILMPDSCCIYVYGALVANGTESNPAAIRPNLQAKATRWGAICIQNATGEVILNHTNILNASTGRNKQAFKAAITSKNSDVSLDGVTIQGADFPFYSEYGNISILNSYLTSDKTCDMINAKYASSAIVENCIIKGNEYPDTDGIDYDQIEDGIIRNNCISGFAGFNSDGIDIGEGAKNILIENNRILNCSDKGISVGQASTAIIKRNLIFNCNLGVGVKDSLSNAIIDQNTFYQNNYAVACFEKNWGDGGGMAFVTNSILSECRISPVLKDELSTINITYSLSDTEALPGVGNLQDNPEFKDPLVMNLELQDDSPCIDAGNPDTPPDPDGSAADIGAYFTYQEPPEVPVVINEINYASHPAFNAGDWVEIYNDTGSEIDLSGWIFKDSKDEHMYRLPENLVLDKKGYLVLCNNTDSFAIQYPSVWNYRGIFDFGLKRNEESLRLFDAQMNLVDLVEYTNKDPWPELADGMGYTLQLMDPSSDNNQAENWNASSELLGNPGRENSGTGIIETGLGQQVKIYPNPSTGRIHFLIDKPGDRTAWVEVINLHGIPVYAGEIRANRGNQANTLDLSHLPSGIYLIRINLENEMGTGKLIIQ